MPGICDDVGRFSVRNARCQTSNCSMRLVGQWWTGSIHEPGFRRGALPGSDRWDGEIRKTLTVFDIPPIGMFVKRDAELRQPLTHRVNRIVGQVQGIGRMIEEDRECPEVLNTIAAVHSALRALEAKLLEDHVRHCVCDAAADSNQLESRLEELITLYRRRLS